MFEQMMTRLNEQIVQLLAHIEIRQPEPPSPGTGFQGPTAPQPPTPPHGQPAERLQAAMAGGDGGGVQVATVSRNALCPCGSGKKYKHCHGKIG
jgi:preprotein translocase subunit SecA